MPVLHIEHPITDIDTWRDAFNRFATVRRRAGVTSERVWQPDDDPRYIVVDLEFEAASSAADFRTFLRERVWSSPDAAPGLAGSPRAVILSEIATA
ncbi:hypothetical protein [Mycobacterium sp. 1081908.1]|uniref:hypothetical protein n=1 Tax=Mycobacterium sp. 1081908.1 TaxID=1834066 RepID=UPI0008003397|nr:hypothetical protein [Mycobacterium sp. 1081908.1]OBK48827.1 hypothetical protein A5655_03455 [Mycobacterium sp. 1081908.1]